MTSTNDVLLEIIRQSMNDSEERRHEIYALILKNSLNSEEVKFNNSEKSRGRATATLSLSMGADEPEIADKSGRQHHTISPEELPMEPAIFVVKAIAGAVLSQSAKDAYESVRDVLKTRFKLGSAVARFEENPECSSEQTHLAEKLTESGALDHQEFREKVAMLVEAMNQDKTLPAPAQVLIEDITAKTAEFRDISVEGSAAVKVSKVKAGKIVLEKIVIKS